MKKYVSLGAICERVTDRAILIDGTWYPKSQLIFVINWNYLDTRCKPMEVKPSDRKTIYTILCPLWLYMKNNTSFKNSHTLDEWNETFNTDDRVDYNYEAYRVLTFKEYQEL